MKTKIKNVLKNFINILLQPEMQVLPGQLAYYIIMSFIPILAICTIVVSYFVSNFNFSSIIYSYLPDAIADIIIPFITTNQNVSIWLLFLCYLFVATTGPRSIINTSNSLYKIDNPNYLSVFLKSFLMTLVLIILLIFMIFIPIFGNTIINLISKYINISSYLGIIKLLKFIMSFIFIYFSVKILYSLAPSRTIKSKTTTIGAIWTTTSWIVATELFAFYITKIAKYDLLYGNFANILMLFIWVYLLSYLFVIGMAININSYNALKTEKLEVKP